MYSYIYRLRDVFRNDVQFRALLSNRFCISALLAIAAVATTRLTRITFCIYFCLLFFGFFYVLRKIKEYLNISFQVFYFLKSFFLPYNLRYAGYMSAYLSLRLPFGVFFSVRDAHVLHWFNVIIHQKNRNSRSYYIYSIYPRLYAVYIEKAIRVI